jgi:hypothetical protein
MPRAARPRRSQRTPAAWRTAPRARTAAPPPAAGDGTGLVPSRWRQRKRNGSAKLGGTDLTLSSKNF